VSTAYWLPPALWMLAIMTASSDVGSAEHTQHWLVPLLRLLTPWATPSQLDALHVLVRKAGHVAEYAVLAALWYRAFRRARHLAPRSAATIAFLISLVWAILDEIRQSFVPSRGASAADVAIDAIGALLAMLVATLGWRVIIDRTTTVLLWIALVGGTAFLILNVLTGVPSGLLWLSPPIAAILLLVRTLNSRRQSSPRP
jgi:VanZ family protein